MKKTVFYLLAAALLAAPAAWAADVGFDLNIHVRDGETRPAAPIIVEEPPLFLVPPTLGFAVAVGAPYDMFYLSGGYYLCRDRVWYRGAAYDGPWTVVSYDRLPPGLRRHKYEKIRYIRDEEYRHYREARNDYRGKTFRPEYRDEHGNGKAKHDHGKHKGRD